MVPEPVAVLLIESSPEQARHIGEALNPGGDAAAFKLEWIVQLPDALRRLETGDIGVVLLDVSPAGQPGIDAVDEVLRAAPASLIVILCSAAEEETARLAVSRGAQDYLLTGRIDAHWLPRTLRYLIEAKRTREALRKSEARFRAMSDASPLGVFVSDPLGRCVYSNPAYQEIAGLSFEQSSGADWSLPIDPRDSAQAMSEWRQATTAGAPFMAEVRFLRHDGSTVWTRVNGAPMQDLGASLGYVQTVEDISARRRVERFLREAEQALFAEKERAEVTLNSIGDAVLSTDTDGRVTYMNAVAETMMGWTLAEAQGRLLEEVFRIVIGIVRRVAPNPAQRAMREDRTVGLSADCILVHRDGRESAIEDSAAPIHDRDGRVAGAVLVFHDVSKSRTMALRMAHLAQHDFLTDLPNRLLLRERLSQAIALGQRRHRQVALLFLDLDYFKHINDSLGHAIGDSLLQAVAARLVSCVRSTDTVCRQGGDEFVILLVDIDSPQDAAQVAEKVLIACAEPYQVGGHELHVSLSVGISVYPDDGGSADVLMQTADTAMYHAKACGRANFQFFHADMNARARHRLSVQKNLRRALAQGEFVIHYQPQVDLATGAMTGAEALIRWQDPDRGLILPAAFIAIAEECGLIVRIGEWVRAEVCRQVRTWQDAHLCPVPVSVNISALEFGGKGFLEGIELILGQTGLAPRFLELELTESVLMHDAEASASVVAALKAMGIRLAIDDFGTGYSSLSYLKRFPISTLKIDQSFVRDIGTDPDDAAIVAAVIGMGCSLKRRVVAEGIETQEQLTLLRSRNCPEGQGYRFSVPLCAADFALLLDKKMMFLL